MKTIQFISGCNALFSVAECGYINALTPADAERSAK